MAEVMNRAARRAADKAEARLPGGSAAAPYLYPGIPAIEDDHDFCPLKAFVVDLELMPALAPRLFLDGHQSKLKDARGTINCLDGPADTDPYRLHLPFAKLREFLASEEEQRRRTPFALDEPGAPPGFTFGLLDIVTYPFRFMLVYPTVRDPNDGDELQAKHWQVNSNLVNIFYPGLRRVASVLSIPHFDEEPIDDAPVHNIVMWRWRSESTETIRGHLRQLLQSKVPTHYVCRERPIMDDRYALHERRPEDGEPFNLLTMFDVIGHP